MAITRRGLLTAAALQGAAPLLARGDALAQQSRRAALLDYFATTGPQLLRPAEGVLS